MKLATWAEFGSDLIALSRGNRGYMSSAGHIRLTGPSDGISDLIAPRILRAFCLLLSQPLGLNGVAHGFGVHIEVSGLVFARKALP